MAGYMSSAGGSAARPGQYKPRGKPDGGGSVGSVAEGNGGTNASDAQKAKVGQKDEGSL